MCVPDRGLPCLFLRRQIEVHADQRINPLCDIRPGDRDLRAVAFFEAHTFCIVILHAGIRAGEGMTVAARAEFVHQEIRLVFLRVRRLNSEIIVYALFAALIITAAGDCRIKLVLRNKRIMRKLRSSLRDNTIPRNKKRGKTGFNQGELMIMPVKERTVGVVGFHKGVQIFFYRIGLVFIDQRLGKLCLLFRIAAADIGIEGGKIFAFSAFLGTVKVEIQEGQSDLAALVAVCFDSLHVGRKLSVAVQVPHALQHVVPGDCLCEWGIPCGSSPTDAKTLIVVPCSVFFSIHDKAVAAVILTP